ncbi:MAG: hypothetical protein M2R45_01526 [Verrucomicrobia subdivision 3 bacterium]|nr:hypothetical protein [Limisphaerales bacterium]MCS1413346.1 hypothetical protein [Limisphaerales bacterium]
MGRFRYLLESISLELRQYIVTNSVEERPFSRDQRLWFQPRSGKMSILVLRPTTIWRSLRIT